MANTGGDRVLETSFFLPKIERQSPRCVLERCRAACRKTDRFHRAGLRVQFFYSGDFFQEFDIDSTSRRHDFFLHRGLDFLKEQFFLVAANFHSAVLFPGHRQRVTSSRLPSLLF